MMRKIYFEYIEKNINILSDRIKINGKLNLLELNIHSETFFRDLLNLIYRLDLKSANKDKSNVEAIDLIDSNKKIVIQVSSTSNTTKINKTLEKKKTKELADSQYNLKFVFISELADKLRNKKYNNIHNIKFEPSKDIIDRASILEQILQMDIDQIKSVYDFIRAELGEPTNTLKRSSNLVSVINNLASADLNEVEYTSELNDYSIVEKIEYNDLMDIKESTFDECKIYYATLNKIYEEFIHGGSNKVISVFSKITSIYEKENIPKDLSNIEKFFNVIGKVQDYVINSGYLNDIPEEEIEMCVRIIVVDAFIRCKIFKNPRGYNYDVIE